MPYSEGKHQLGRGVPLDRINLAAPNRQLYEWQRKNRRRKQSLLQIPKAVCTFCGGCRCAHGHKSNGKTSPYFSKLFLHEPKIKSFPSFKQTE